MNRHGLTDCGWIRLQPLLSLKHRKGSPRPEITG
jgi:hypothetical protein